ncbi:hypothetical protein Mth01_45060 [Sphaerimonospora thailandensis]|uniref:Uncharacterized protein n=2 Tax=Sphaerimonospora thailandensis TaxID=795644 RepID=A0A8J3RH56_9ACTN|nr:hypothetical protein Mth01_45060 [Sphaerimonospora thailandensis]
MEASPPLRTAEVLRAGIAVLTERLPNGWALRVREDDLPHRDHLDRLATVTAPGGTTATLVLEVKRLVQSRDVPHLLERLETLMGKLPDSHGVVVARYLSEPVRRRLSDAGLSYVDATGNVRINVSHPGLYIADRGADRDPWRGPGRPRGTLKGAPAARIVRALIDADRAWPIRTLIDFAGVSTGSTYRVIEYLESEGLIVRDDAGAVIVPDWVSVLRRWSIDYGFVGNSLVTRWIAPRGLPDLVRRASASSVTYVFTGTVAAAEWAPYAPARSAMIYVADAEQAAMLWGLRRTDAGANVMLAEPQIDVVFTRHLVTASQLSIAAPAQVAVDLMTGPGRAPSEAEELIEWMKRNEASWRR